MKEIDLFINPDDYRELRKAGYVVITNTALQKFIQNTDELLALKAWGVDNWEGYSDAMADLLGEIDDDDGPYRD